jgi:hypothetical protein
MAIFLFNLVAFLGLTLFVLSNQVRRKRDLITLIAKIYIAVIVIGNIILFYF